MNKYMGSKPFIITYIIITIIFVLFNIFKYDLVIIADSSSTGSIVVLGLVEIILNLIYAALLIISAFFAIIKLRSEKLKAILPLLAGIIIISLLYVFPITNLYLNWNYNANKMNREKILNMVQDGSISNYQIGMNEYKVPFRQSSYTGKMYVQESDNVTKVMFYMYRGRFGSKALFYLSDDSNVKAEDFNFGYAGEIQDFMKMSRNWYVATIKR